LFPILGQIFTIETPFQLDPGNLGLDSANTLYGVKSQLQRRYSLIVEQVAQ